MKLIRKKELVENLMGYVDGEKTIGECIDDCTEYDLKKIRNQMCDICGARDCEKCPLEIILESEGEDD